MNTTTTTNNKTMTLTELQKINPLARAVVRQLGGWEPARQSLPDIARHGMAGGFSGFIYYRETAAFWRRNRKAILTLLSEYAADTNRSVIEMVLAFCLLGPEYSPDKVAAALFGRYNAEFDAIYNAAAWFAAENVAADYVNATE